MGSKHPISLRLKTKQNWKNTSYHFNSKNSLHQYWGLDIIALNVIKHYFQFALISKPKFNKDSNKVTVGFYYFINLPVSKRLNFGQSKRIQSSLQEGSLYFEAKRFSSLILKLSNLYGKPVELRPVRVHYPYLNSYILAQYIAFCIKAGNFNKLIRNLFIKARLVKNNNSTSIRPRGLIKYSSVFNGPQYLTGIKIKVSGRLSQRKASSRTAITTKSIGSLNLSSNTIIDASKFSFTGKNGSITVKVWLNSSYKNFSTGIIKDQESLVGDAKITLETNNNKNESFVPVIIYSNAEINKAQLLTDNKRKTGIYQWKHNESGKIYIGSAVDLSKRLNKYFSLSELNRWDNYIARALINHTHSAFSLSILEYIDSTSLSKEEVRKLLLSREQYYLDYIFSVVKPNIYNTLKVAGSSLGYKHTPESLAKMSGENNSMFGKSHSSESLQKMSEAKSGENHPMFGKTHSAETKAKMSDAKTGENHPMFGKCHSSETLLKISEANIKKVYVYSFDSESKISIFYKEFSSCTEAALFFDCSNATISGYLDKKKLYKKQWLLSSSLITKG